MASSVELLDDGQLRWLAMETISVLYYFVDKLKIKHHASTTALVGFYGW